jgi:lipoprotein-releasing system ATP-binding protein
MSEALKTAALRLDKVARVYAEGTGTLEVFSNVSLSLKQGEVVALVGQSGAGKSSLLHMAGLLEAPSSGDVIIGGAAAASLPDAERTRLRRDTIGFVYQAHHLLPEFSALENVILPQLIAGKSMATADAEAASSSAWLSPARSPIIRACFWPTSRPATSIRAPPAACSTR